MEVEFDKEIDAILRKTRSGIGVTAASSDHLDADMIAAFAESALPDKAKLFYIEHFADCDRCRKHLAFAMQMNTEEAESATASSVSEPLAATVIPWYQTLFKAPNLAFAMGALVLAFGGILGYIALQQQRLGQNATVSQITETEQSRGAPNLSGEGSAANAAAPLDALIATANPTAPAFNAAAANSVAIAPGESSKLAGRTDSNIAKSGAAPENNFILDGQDAGAPPPKPEAPSVTTDVTSSGIAAERDEKKADDLKLKEESKDLELAKKRQAEDRGYRDMPRAAAKAGPSRAGPVQSQLNQMNSNMPVTRVVGGKTFNSRDGAWYDATYHNQTTINFRRSSVDYKKLDSGLRSIADTLGGTVVIVWKSKAYRIQ